MQTGESRKKKMGEFCVYFVTITVMVTEWEREPLVAMTVMV